MIFNTYQQSQKRTPNMIKLVPLGGLCNRMRAIDSAISLANSVNQKLEVFWVIDSEMSQNFHDLFKPITHQNIVVRTLNTTPISLQRGKKGNLYAPNVLSKILSTEYFDEFSLDELKAFDFNANQSNQNTIIRSFSRFHANTDMYKLFVPIQDVDKRIEARSSTFDKFTIGVHIRRTDNSKSISNSPNELFVEAMEAEICKEPDTNYYLATDCEETKLFFSKIFGSKIVYSAKSATRDSLDGIQEAMVELYSLSRTKKVFGSYWSSFSSTACHIGKIEEVVISKNSN
jgi:hypothetical protein